MWLQLIYLGRWTGRFLSFRQVSSPFLQQTTAFCSLHKMNDLAYILYCVAKAVVVLAVNNWEYTMWQNISCQIITSDWRAPSRAYTYICILHMLMFPKSLCIFILHMVLIVLFVLLVAKVIQFRVHGLYNTQTRGLRGGSLLHGTT